MPITTQHYMLEAFLDGDAYSSIADMRRFSTIDAQLNIITEIIGDGRIDGWEITPLTFPNIRITQGRGFINGYYVETFDDQDFELSSNGTFYVYAQRRVGISGTVGPRSNIVSVTYTDTSAPAAPSGFTANTPSSPEIDPYFNIELTWAANSEIDFDHYEIERAIDPLLNFTLIATVPAGTTQYIDKVDEDTSYIYKIYAVDKSGFRSPPSTDTHTTGLSPVLPPNPIEVKMLASEGAINILWKRPVTINFNKIASWSITWVRLKPDGSEIPATQGNKIINRVELHDRIDNLLNGETYRVTIQTIDTKGRSSGGISRDISPQLSTAPKDPEGISVTETELVEGSVVLDFTWTDGTDEYDPLIPYRYQIYVTVDGQQESQPIFVPIGETSERVELYTFDGVNFHAIPQNTLVTFRFTSLSKNGIESAGNYIRFITSNFSIPKPVIGLKSIFDEKTGKITVTWTNPTDISDVTITVLDDDLGDDYPPITLINGSIGLVEQYIFDGELNHTYTITITPINSLGISGPGNTIVEVTVLPGGFPAPEIPREIFFQPGDRQITFSWSASPSISTASYNIYRKLGVISTISSDWTLIDNVPKTKLSFVDYGLENNEVYSYYITSVDIYNQESLHLPDGAVNLNFFEAVPKASGILTEPDNVQATLTGNSILITWNSLVEEFDAFTIYRSIGNLHSWKDIANLDRNSSSYIDQDLTLINETTFYYTIGKTINDSDIIVQTSNIAPENSILLGSITLDGSSFSDPNYTGVRNIKDLIDPLSEYTSTYLLTHQHRGTKRFDPERIDLNPELIVTNWSTVDGRIFTTEEFDISGTGHIVKIDGRFPKVLFHVDQTLNRLVFTEPIVTVDDFGNVIGDLPKIEMRVLGVEEIQGILSNERFNNIHARQVAFGRLNKEQMPDINHEGRIREKLLPKSFLLERFSNHTFIVPQGNTDATKNFGNGTTFYTTIESDGLIKEVIDWDQEDDGTIVGFNLPSFSVDTLKNLKQNIETTIMETVNDIANEYRFKEGVFFGHGNGTVPYLNPFWAFNRDFPGSTIDLIAPTGLFLTDLAIDSVNDRVLGIISGADIGDQSELFSISLFTGKNNLIGKINDKPGLTREIIAFTYNNTNNTLYLITTKSTTGEYILASLDESTMQLTTGSSIMSSGNTFTALEYNSDSNTLYATSTGPNTLWTVNLVTGVATKVHPTNEIGYTITALTYDYDTSFLYGIELQPGGSNLIKIDPSTGIGTLIDFFADPSSGGSVGIAAPPKDKSFWKVGDELGEYGSNEIKLGNFPGIFSDAYLRFPCNIETGSVVGQATLGFTARDDLYSTGDINLKISVLDPSLYIDDINLTTEAIRSIGTLPTVINWSPPDWNMGENSNNTMVDVREIIQDFIDAPGYHVGKHVIFKIETLSSTPLDSARYAYSYDSPNRPTLDLSTVVDLAEVSSDQSFQSEKSYHFKFEFEDTQATRWVRITSQGVPKFPNPIIDLKKRLRFKMQLSSLQNSSGAIYVSLGIRELTLKEATTGDNGGTTGPIEWVGVSEVIIDSDGNRAPIGHLVEGEAGVWQDVEFNLEKEDVQIFSDDSNGILEGTYGVLEHIGFTVVPESNNATGPFDIYIDKIEQVDDVLVAGTSQGIQISRDFGTSWNLVRYVETPVHKFYRAINNPFLWAVGTNTVLISIDPANWFETSGLTGVQYIRDITEDDFGNMYISTEKGVYWFETALIKNFSSWRQTQPITAFTTDCYGLYHYSVASGVDEIWVSTEIGIFKTQDMGQTWVDTNMDTQGLPAYQFINISSDSQLPNVICITRKHVLRKLGAEDNFSVLANFEVQHNIFDIWIMEYFAGHLYISTGSGVYWNPTDELFVPGITTVFERIFPKLNINGHTAVAFGLDAVNIQAGETRLFIGQENRLMMADELNTLSIKEQFPNKELPSFFANDDEINIGYVYNAFNNVLIFREPQPVDIIYKASYLPRKFYTPINGGWAQTNPSTDVFIYVNGHPKWLDFRLDESAILSELQVLQGKLSPIQGSLTDFNSLHPTASETLKIVLSDIDNMIKGGTDETPIINNETIIQFLQDYSRFLSLITKSVIIDNELDIFPKFNITGFPATQRDPGSRAAILEEQEDFIANNSTGINIDTYTGEIDFLTIFTETTNEQDRLEYVFDKYDNLSIVIFNANVANTGEFSHRELEDQMEAVNTGLTSHLSRAHYANLIKAGVFLETKHPFLFDAYNASNVQSKYNSAHNNLWYDILNSTVDYNSVLKVKNGEESRFANDLVLFTENPYLIDRIWVATDSDIIQYQFDTNTGLLSLENSIRPGNGFSPLFIWDIFVLNENDIYVVAEEKDSKVGHIYRSIDAGNTWEELETINVPQQIYSFVILNGNKIVGTENGIFYSDNNFGTWFPGNLVLSNRISENSPTVNAFSQRIINIENNNFLIAESDRWFYTSGGGLDWLALGGQMTANEVTVINKIHRFKNLTWIGTDKGLYNDGNSILSDNVQFGLQTELEDSSNESANINVMDIDTGSNALYCAAGNKIYRFLDNMWNSYEVPELTSIHKIMISEGINKDFLIIVGHNIIQTIDVTNGTGVFG